jgi:hypothetical protein
MRFLTQTLVAATLAGLLFSLPGLLSQTPPPDPGPTVYLARGLSDEGLMVLGAALGENKQAMLLLDSERLTPYLKAFLEALRPGRVVPVGTASEDLEERLGVKPDAVVEWTKGPPVALWRTLLPEAQAVVICAAQPRRLLVQAAGLAAAARAPLWVLRGKSGEAESLRAWAAGAHVSRAWLVGPGKDLARILPGAHHVRLADVEAVAAAHRRLSARLGPMETIVVANPADVGEGGSGLSALAPWVAAQKRAALLLCGPSGEDVEARVTEAARNESLRRAENLLLVADLKAIPWRRRPNPVAGKDEEIEMEPLTPTGTEPFSFAVGRLFHQDPAVVPLTLARQRLLAQARGPRKALVVSNPGGGLSLLETLSRNTATELANAGYETTTRFANDVRANELRRLLPHNDVFLWEGHHNTLIREFGFANWVEPLPPALMFLQSCLALVEPEAQPLLSRGAVAVIGSSTRTYSGSGGACSLAFFDALLYDGQSLGGSLRQAKNFLLACSLLKEQRLGNDAAHKGAGLRSAWAFSLWGDPTLRLPAPARPADAPTAVRHEVSGHSIVLHVPAPSPQKVQTDKYQAAAPANGRLAGIVRKEKDEDDRKPLVPLVFAEVRLPKVHPGETPRLSSKLPSSHWVFLWDSRRRCGYLLASPRPQDVGTSLHFHARWESPAGSTEAAQAPR